MTMLTRIGEGLPVWASGSLCFHMCSSLWRSWEEVHNLQLTERLEKCCVMRETCWLQTARRPSELMFSSSECDRRDLRLLEGPSLRLGSQAPYCFQWAPTKFFPCRSSANMSYELCVLSLCCEIRDLHPQCGKQIKTKACFLWSGGNRADIREPFCVCLIWQWGGLGMPVSSKAWKLSSGWSFLQRGLYFIPWHFWEGRKVWSGWFCNDSFLAAVFFSVFLTLQKALPVLRSDPIRDVGGRTVPFC